MSLEVKAAEKLQDILHVYGLESVLFHFIEHSSEVLGVADTGLVRGALLTAYRLVRDHGKPTKQLFTLLGALADGTTFARAILSSGQCAVPPAQRLGIDVNLDESGWRLQRAAETARKAALDE